MPLSEEPSAAWPDMRKRDVGQKGAHEKDWHRPRWPAVAVMLVTALLPLAVAAATHPHPSKPQGVAGVPALSPEARALHVLNRLAYGPAPGDLDRVMKMGPDAYIAEQLHPESVPENPALQARLEALPSWSYDTVELFERFGPSLRKAAGGDNDKVKQVDRLQNQVADDAREAHLLQAAYSHAQLREVLVDFWFNHFNVFIDKGQEEKIWIGRYERDAIRPYVLGRFRDLLGATAQHPAMLFYLDNVQSSALRTDKSGKTSGGLNENYAREVMELHTLGVDGGYTQQDVTELARILTGWGYDSKRLESGLEPAFYFNPAHHDGGEKHFLGHVFAAGGGEEEGEHALDLLAANPATARHISEQLAQYFVADNPPPRLVQAMVRRWRETDGDLRAVMETLFQQPEFWAAEQVHQKFKTPWQYLVSSLRVSGLPMPLNAKPLFGVLYQSSAPLYGCISPDGYKNTEAAWLNPDAMIYRLNFANALGNGYSAAWQPKPVDTPTDVSPAMTMMMLPAAEKATPPAKPQPPDPFVMQAALGNSFSLATAEALAAARPPLRPGLMLGSPEFMRR